MSEGYLTVTQAANQLRLHPKTVLRLIHEQRLRGTRIGKSYRISPSDLRAFGGGSSVHQHDSNPVRVSCAVDVPDLSVSESERLASMLNALLLGRHVCTNPIHLNTIYDPTVRSLKTIIVGSPNDVAVILSALDPFLGALR